VKRFNPYERPQVRETVKRATPEYEGSFVVKMPRGTTPKTRRLLRDIESQSVFERLGKDNNSNNRTTVRKLKTAHGSYGSNSMVSDMRRLGLGRSQSVGEYEEDEFMMIDNDGNLYTTVPADEDDEEDSREQLQYQGVLKPGPQRAHVVQYSHSSNAAPTKPILKKSVSFAGGDSRAGGAGINRMSAPNAGLVRAVVTKPGRKINSSASQGIFGSGSMTAQQLSVHNRLGNKNNQQMDEDDDDDDDHDYGQTSTSVSTVLKKTKTVISRPNLTITTGQDNRMSEGPKVYISTRGFTGNDNSLLQRSKMSRTKSISTTTTNTLPMKNRISLANKGDIFSRLGNKKMM
jgi:hypothetical protein